MSISGISFWQQDQVSRSRQAAWDQQLSDASALSSTLTTALANQTTGLAGIANQQALNRVSTQIAAAQGSNSSTSTASSSAASNTGASSSASSVPVSSATNLLSGTTAVALLAGQIPSGSLLSILA
jgi:hypothetical protein